MNFSQLLQFGFFLFSFALNKTTENFTNIQTNAERVRSKIKLNLLFFGTFINQANIVFTHVRVSSHVFGPLEGHQSSTLAENFVFFGLRNKFFEK